MTTLAALVLGGYLAPAALLVALVIPGALLARVMQLNLTRAALVTLPFAVAVTLVSVFTRPGAIVLFELGPFHATLEGADFAARVTLRLFVMAAALTLFGLTTPTRSLIVDLERRGVSPRLAFAGGAIVGTVPAMVERARRVLDAVRTRGLDTEGHALRRVAAVVPLVGPVVIGALHGVEARSLALEARAFGRPGPRHLLWAPVDSARERALRWLLVGALLVLVVATISGTMPRLP